MPPRRIPDRLAAVWLGFLAAAAPLTAQELRWQLPPRGAAVYTRSLKVDETIEPKGAWIPRVWQGEPQVAAVFAGELAPDRQRTTEAAYDPREFLKRASNPFRNRDKAT